MRFSSHPFPRVLSVIVFALCAFAARAQVATDGAAWRAVPGDAQAISVAADGTTVAAGRDARLWLWRPQQNNWAPLPGEALRVAALTGGRLLAIRRDGALEYFDGLRFAATGLEAIDVAADAQGRAFALRRDGALMRRGAEAWEATAAPRGQRLALLPDGAVWLLQENGTVLRWFEDRAEPLAAGAPALRDIATSPEGAAAALDAQGRLLRWEPGSGSWEIEAGAPPLAAIALGPQGVPWGISAGGAILTRAPLQLAGVRFDDVQGTDGGVRFGGRGGRNSFGAGGTGGASGLPAARRGAALAGLTPAAQVTDLSPIEWIDTLANAAGLAIAQEGSVFALLADGSLARWSNLQRRFLAFPGQLAKIAVDPFGSPWGINASGRIFRHDGDWRQVRGAVSDLSVGVRGEVYANTAAGALLRYDRPSDGLVPVAGQLFNVAVAPDGATWGLAADGAVQRCVGFECRRFTRSARSLSVGPDGSVFIVAPDGLLLRQRKGEDAWDIVPLLGLRALQVAVGPKGRPWVVAETGRVYAAAFFPRDESTDLLMASVTVRPTTGTGDTAEVATTSDISTSKSFTFQSIPVSGAPNGLFVGPDGGVLVISTANNQLQRYDSNTNKFVAVTGVPGGNIRHAKTGPDGKLWIMSADVDGRLFHQISGSQYETIQLPIANPQAPSAGNMNRPVNIGPDGAVYAIDTAGTLYHRPAGSTTFSRLISGSYRNVSIRRNGDIWVLDNSFVVRQIVNGRAERRPSNRDVVVQDIAGGGEGTIYITIQANGSTFPYKWNAASETWDRVNQLSDLVGVGPNGLPWLLDTNEATRVLRARASQ